MFSFAAGEELSQTCRASELEELPRKEDLVSHLEIKLDLSSLSDQNCHNFFSIQPVWAGLGTAFGPPMKHKLHLGCCIHA